MKKLICVLLLLCIVGCTDIMYGDKLIVKEVDEALEKGLCRYDIDAFIFDVAFIDKCGLYTVGDKLVLSKANKVEEKEK